MERDHRFQEGDPALLIDRKDRRYLVTLGSSDTFHSHAGTLPHAEVIGREHGTRVRTSRGQSFLVMPPTLGDYITHLPRSSQVIYPKDLGAILLYADVFPGARILEAGMGSGGLTSVLLRAVGPAGAVYSYEVRREVVAKARRNVETLVGSTHNLTVHLGDVYEGVYETEVDRVVLDLSEPWRAIPQVTDALVDGGVFLAYVPTALQVYEVARALQEHPRYDLVESQEVIVRPWHVAERSVRPVHRMVAHTGFMVTARKCAPRPTPAPPQPA